MPSTVGIVASGLWTPLELSPLLWLDAADTTTITASSGSVSQWNDKSGNGNNVSQGNAANQPTTGIATIDGKNVISYDGNDDLLSGSSITFTGLTMFAVLQHTSEDFVLLGTDLSNVWAGAAVLNSTSTSLVSNLGTMSLRFNGSPFTGTTRAAVYNELASSTKVVTLEVSASETRRLRPFSYTGDGFRPVGAIAEVIIVNGSLTAGAISTAESYLADKWGVTL
jgi:hypothetical protein